MNPGKTILAGIVGGAVAFLLGFLAYGILLMDFFQSQMGSATGVMREQSEMLWVPMVIGHLSLGMLFAVIFGHYANITTFSRGAVAGGTIGFLIALAYDMINYGSTHTMLLSGAIVDVFVTCALSAILGGVVGWFLGRK